MKIFNLSNGSNGSDNNSAKYLQLAGAIRHKIRNGTLISGDLLPSVKLLSEDLKINRHTVMKAFAELIAEGWIESQQRVGYKVALNIPIESSQHLDAIDENTQQFEFRLIRSGMTLPTNPANQFMYNFSGGQPDLTHFPFNEFKRHMSAALSKPKHNQLSYGENEGVAELIEQVKIYLRKSRAITDREIIITNGSQEALFIIAQLLLQPGDKVAVEALGYPPAMSAFKNAGADLVGIQQDAQGIVPTDLEAKIQQGNIRLIYLTPLHQYPTTITLPISRRMTIYQLAAKHRIPIIEDDYDHEFHYRCQPLAPMASQDPQQLVIYMSTFSKIMFPGARIGILAVNKNLAKAVAEYRMMICHKGNVFMQMALAKWMQSGGFERHLRRMTRANMLRRDHAVACLQDYDCFEFGIPDGGMALWVKVVETKLKNTSLNTAELAKQALELGVYMQHEKHYHTHPQHNRNNHLRIGYAGMTESQFSKGITLIASLID